MTYLLWVALGGAVGASLRYGALQLAVSRGAIEFPWSTLAVNLAGSFLLAVITAWAAGPGALWERQPGLRLFMTTGLMGALTTYSTFNLEVLHLAMGGRWRAAAAYLFATLLGAAALGLLGFALGRALHS